MFVPVHSILRTPYSTTAATPSAANSVFFSFTFFDLAQQLRNDTTITTVGVYSDSADSALVIKIGLRTGAGTFDIVHSQAVSHAGGGFQNFTLSTPYYVSATGTYYLGGYSTSTTTSGIPANSRAFKSGDITGTGQSGFTENSNNTPSFRASGYQGK